jgi:hypothetical protein
VFAERTIDVGVKNFLGSIKSVTQDAGASPKILDPTDSTPHSQWNRELLIDEDLVDFFENDK